MAFKVRRFEWGLALRLAAAIGFILLFLLSFRRAGLPMTHVVLGCAAIGATAMLWNYLGRTNRAIARFVDSIRYDDFAQRFNLGGGAGFDELGRALDSAIVELGRRRMAADEEVRFLRAVVDDAPVALLMIEDGDRVTLLNKAARRQFGALGGARIGDYRHFGSEFQTALALPGAGRRVTRMLVDGAAQRTMLESARIERLGQDLRIVSLLPVQNMLGSAEMAAQSDLVRVLTHEIMNSLTPVTSLARTAADLLGAAQLSDNAELADARIAIDTVARRAEGMHRFVESYRAFANAPDVRRRLFDAGPWAAGIERLFRADPASRGVAIVCGDTAGATIDGDPELLAQLCLNLLRNAATAAAAHCPQPEVRFGVSVGAGGQAIITVSDNGPGIPPDRRDDIFLPFYTTRSDGHGVGLSFVRQIAVAHGGSVAVDDSPDGGALLRVVLPRLS